MKKIVGFLFPLLLLSLASCQTEEYEVLTEQDQNSITTNMEAYDLVQRAAMYDGSADDKIDNSPCFSIEFPYTVNYQGAQRNITSETILKDFLADLPANVPNIVPNFPITVTNTAHQRIPVMNRQQFAGLQQACRNMTKERGRSITCAKFSFPLRINSYDRSSQQTNSAVLNSQEELYTYFDNLTASSVVSFEYPLKIMIGNSAINVNNRSALVSAIKACEE